MKIVILSAFYEPFMSGAEQMAKEIAERLGKHEKIVLITARLNSELPRHEVRQDFFLERVGIGHPKIDKFLFPLLSAWRLRYYQPEIVHAIMESYAGLALVFSKLFFPQAKRILTLQAGNLAEPSRKNYWFYRLILKMIHRSPDKITAISNFLASRALSFGVPAERIVVIPNGVELSRIPFRLEKIPYRVICVARLSWEKGLKYLIKAWPEVLAKLPKAQLLIIGEGSERRSLEALISELKLVDSITLRGQENHDQVLKEMSKSSLFVCPSLAEGLGIVFIEAQACGVPVIGTKVGGIPDVVEADETGLLVPPRDPFALSRAIIRLLTDELLARSLRDKALARVKRYEWGEIVKKIELVYKNL